MNSSSLGMVTCILFSIASTQAVAQEAVNEGLDQCIQKRMVSATAKGALIGGLAGFGNSLLGKSDKKKDGTAKNVVIGAIAGGAIGFATSYFQAAGKCFKKNPSWIPESKLARTQGYEQAVKELGYKPEQGVVVSVRNVQMPSTIKPGQTLDISTSFVLLTPTGAETPVTIERKLYAIVEGKETELPFYGKGSEERIVEPGVQTDEAHLPIPSDVVAGSAYRIEYSISVGEQAPVKGSATVTVN